MAKNVKTGKVWTEAEVMAAIAKAKADGMAEGVAAAKAAKSKAREERKAAMVRKGWTLFPHSVERAANNMLAEGIYVADGGIVIEGSAVMVKHGDTFKPRFRLAVNPIWGINGDTDTDVKRLTRAMVAKGKAAPEMLASLSAAYDANVEGHTFRDKAAERKAKAEQAEQEEGNA